MGRARAFQLGLMCALGLAASPALADVKDGVDAWSRGDWNAAVAEWQGPAAQGDPDALFNLAQAYRLGRGVQLNKAEAEKLYRAAAEGGHIGAADTYGLLLFQDGRREQALPFVKGAAERGDPRAQYLLGIAHFNGDLVEQDWVRAYALLTLANGSGLPQAAGAITQMDGHIPMAQRQQAAGLALQMRQAADTARAQQLAAADLATDRPVSAAPATARAPQPTPAIPRPIERAPQRPSVYAAKAALAEAARVTGTESPSEAGADFARPQQTSVAAPVIRPAPRPAAPAPRVAAAPQRAAAPAPATSSGPWKIQLGAFGVRGNAEKLWSRLANRPELAGKQRLLIPSGRVTKLLAGGYRSRGAAQNACNALKRNGQDCLVTR